MSCTSPCDGREHDLRLRSGPLRPSPCAARGARRPSSSPRALCSTNGSCIWPEPNSSPTTFMPVEQVIVDDLQRRVRLSAPRRGASSRSSLLAVDDVALELLFDREIVVGRSRLRRRPRRRPGNSPMKCSSGSKSRAAVGPLAPRRSKISHCAAFHCSSSILLRGRILLACTIARGQARARAASCRKTRVQHDARGGLQAEADVGQPDDDAAVGEALARSARCLRSSPARCGDRPRCRWRSGTTSGSNSRSRSSQARTCRANRSRMRSAIASLRSAVLAMPACWSSSMVSATHAAP